jgi:small-conductance mechanosensitive channel
MLLGLKAVLENISILQRPTYKPILSMLKSTIHLIIIILTLILALTLIGIDVQGIITGLGLLSLAIGLALKDVITSFVASYVLLFYKPFSIGDKVSIKGVTGIVSKMDTRYTVLSSRNEINLIPNSEIMISTITINVEPSLKDDVFNKRDQIDSSLTKGDKWIKKARKSHG